MKRVLLLLVIASCLFSCSSNKKSERMQANKEDAPLEGDTTPVKKHQPLSSFRKVTVYDASTVEIAIGNGYDVEIDGAKVYADAQQADVDGDELIVKYADHDSNHRKTAVRISVPSLGGVKLVGCGKFTLLGSELHASHVDIDLQRVNVAILSPCLVAKKVSLSLSGVMFAQCKVECEQLNISAHSISHAKVFGKAQSFSIDSDNPKAIDVSGLKGV